MGDPAQPRERLGLHDRVALLQGAHGPAVLIKDDIPARAPAEPSERAWRCELGNPEGGELDR
jgi:hypothetical protein